MGESKSTVHNKADEKKTAAVAEMILARSREPRTVYDNHRVISTNHGIFCSQFLSPFDRDSHRLRTVIVESTWHGNLSIFHFALRFDLVKFGRAYLV